MTDQFPGATKMVLSPAAQAVLNAAEDAYGYNYSDFHCCADRVAAASLRAVVKHLSYQLPFEDASCIDVVDLLAIADELEALPND